MAEKTFLVECTMDETYIPYFYSFLKKMQYNGEIGHSGIIAFMADGDGDFRPKFETNIACDIVNPSNSDKAKEPPEALYDRG